MKFAALLLAALALAGCSGKLQAGFANTYGSAGWNPPQVHTSTGITMLDLGTYQPPDMKTKCHIYLIPHGDDSVGAEFCSNGTGHVNVSTTHVEHSSD